MNSILQTKSGEDKTEIDTEIIRFVNKHADPEPGPSASFGQNFLEWKRTFWKERIAKIKNVVAPMVDQSELAFRMMLRRHSAHLCFTPMIHAHLFVNDTTYRKLSFTTVDWDRPLIVQFCANDPQTLLNACRLVEGMCDGVDLNLGCPQLIAKKGHYGAFLQESPDLISSMISAVHQHCHLPISAKIRVLSDLPSTIAYAQLIQEAGASMLTVHGRTREQKGMNTGVADWSVIKAIKQSLQIPVMANGNIQMAGDVERCLEQTEVEAVMSAEGILSNPLLFDGLNPLSFEVALEYLEFAVRYKAGFSAVRAHLFRICHHSFLKNDDLREKNGIVCTMREFRENIEELRRRCLKELSDQNIHYKDLDKNKFWSDTVQRCYPDAKSLEEVVLSTPHYFCKPYIRPASKQPIKTVLDSSGTPIETQVPVISDYRKQRRAEIERLATEAGVSKRQIRKREKRKRMQKKEFNRKQTFPKCQRCQKPSGVNCRWAMCRRCCKLTCTTKWDEEQDELHCCKAHNFMPNTIGEKWKRVETHTDHRSKMGEPELC